MPYLLYLPLKKRKRYTEAAIYSKKNIKFVAAYAMQLILLTLESHIAHSNITIENI